ncbi:MAG: hypothetical protein ACXWQQ_04775 [Pseudobdellovibrio sp.]
MKSLLSILVVAMAFNSYAQTETTATPAPATDTVTEQPLTGTDPAAAAAPTDDSNATPAPAAPAKPVVKKAAGTSKVAAKKPEPPKSPWGASTYLDVNRGANINYSKLLDQDYPDQRTEGSAELGVSLKYKFSDKNSWSLTQKISRDFVKNPADDTKNDYNVKNMTTSFTHKSDLTFLGSNKIAFPLIITLPTNKDARAKGLQGGLATDIVFSWDFNPTFSFSWETYTGLGFYEPQDQDVAYSSMLQKSNLTTFNEIALTMNITDTVSVWQKVNSSMRAVNLSSLDQQGANIGLTSGISVPGPLGIGIDIYVAQVAPLQGNGFGATQVYSDNMFKIYHEAQTSYGTTLSKSF